MLAIVALASADHGARHAPEDPVETGTSLQDIPELPDNKVRQSGVRPRPKLTCHLELQPRPAEIRHHVPVIMPYPMLAYRNTAGLSAGSAAPLVQYVPIYTNDPRLLNIQTHASANLLNLFR